MSARSRTLRPTSGRAALRALVVAILVASLVALAGPGHAGPRTRAGTDEAAKAVKLRQGDYGQVCGVTARIWMQEHGKSGVNRFRTRYYLRGAYDPGHRFLPSHRRSPWIRTTPFPNDERSFYHFQTLPASFLQHYAGNEYSLHVKIVFERPSWWQHDIVTRGNVGRFACEVDVGFNS